MSGKMASDYKNYFSNMLLDFLDHHTEEEYPPLFIKVRSESAAHTYLNALKGGDQPCLALDKACDLLFEGFEEQDTERA